MTMTAISNLIIIFLTSFKMLLTPIYIAFIGTFQAFFIMFGMNDIIATVLDSLATLIVTYSYRNNSCRMFVKSI